MVQSQMTTTPKGFDIATLLQLNAAHQRETSVLDEPAMAMLLRSACHVGVRGEGGRDGFLIALDQDAAYDSPNFNWFKQRYPRFAYVDRIIVAGTSRGRGLARSLYEELIERAARAGHGVICAEINLTPPNPPSDAFHAALGFREVGRSVSGPGQKFVRYVVKEIGEEIGKHE